jgi:hypothetical protein
MPTHLDSDGTIHKKRDFILENYAGAMNPGSKRLSFASAEG